MSSVSIRAFAPDDLDKVLEIAIAAWQPIFESARKMIGDELFDVVAPDPDQAKRDSIVAASKPEDPRRIWIAEQGSEIVGFITVGMNHKTKVGEIGNNAVSPNHVGRGVGPQMYRYVLAEMKRAGMRGARVTTGSDDAHAPARKAYEKVGFSAPTPSVEYHIKL